MPFSSNRVRAFFSYYRPYRGLFAADLICSFGCSAVGLAVPALIRHITTLAQGGSLGADFRRAAAVLAGVIIAGTFCGIFSDAMGHVMGARMERDMRAELFDKYLALPFGFFDREKPGALLSRLSGDLLELAEFYHHGPENFFLYAVTFAGALVMLLRINVPLALTVLAFLPFIALYSLIFLPKLNRAYKESRERIADVGADVEDALNGIRTVKSFAAAAEEREKFAAVNEAYTQARQRIYKNEAWFFSAMEFFFVPMLTAGIVTAGGVLISRQQLSAADLIAFLLYAAYLTSPIPKLAWIIPQFQNGFACFSRFRDIMDLDTEKNDGKEKAAAGSAGGGSRPCDHGGISGRIIFDNVSFKYHDDADEVLTGVSLEIKAGEFVALVGPSGAGKSTLCALIPRYYERQAGSITIDGVDVRDRDLDALRKSIGVVQQEVYLFAGTVRENIAFGRPGAADAEIAAAAEKADAAAFIAELPAGYDTFIGPRGLQLSGGQRQRLSIARVFLKDPAILIFDEATSSLDNESEAAIRRSLAALARSRTTLVIAHRLSTIRQADRIIVLTKEGIAEQGRHDELMARGGVYAGLYRAM